MEVRCDRTKAFLVCNVHKACCWLLRLQSLLFNAHRPELFYYVKHVLCRTSEFWDVLSQPRCVCAPLLPPPLTPCPGPTVPRLSRRVTAAAAVKQLLQNV